MLNKEVIRYVFWGGLTTLVSILSFKGFRLLGIELLIANVLSWIVAVSFAYITNTLYVFQKTSLNIIEFIKFAGSRVLTLVMELVVIYIFVNLLSIDELLTKVLAQVLVFVANYLISKYFIFKEKDE